MKINKVISLINSLKKLEEFTNLYSSKFDNYSLEDAYFICESIAKNHYENFPVGSLLIPKSLRKYFFSIYAFSRFCDDIADEKHSLSKEQRLEILTNFQGYLREYKKIDIKSNHPILLALTDTLEIKNLPEEPLIRLLDAFKMDINFQQPNRWQDLLDYCYHSANPIGEMILRLFGEWNSVTEPLSNNITTALQLINFWQDLSVDRPNNRNYIPREVSNENLDEVLDYTEKILNLGIDLPTYLNSKHLRLEVIVIIKAAKIMLQKERNFRSKLFNERPKLNKFDYIKILFTIKRWKY